MHEKAVPKSFFAHSVLVKLKKFVLFFVLFKKTKYDLIYLSH